jgi:hypothetical protein
MLCSTPSDQATPVWLIPICTLGQGPARLRPERQHIARLDQSTFAQALGEARPLRHHDA